MLTGGDSEMLLWWL